MSLKNSNLVKSREYYKYGQLHKPVIHLHDLINNIRSTSGYINDYTNVEKINLLAELDVLKNNIKLNMINEKVQCDYPNVVITRLNDNSFNKVSYTIFNNNDKEEIYFFIDSDEKNITVDVITSNTIYFYMNNPNKTIANNDCFYIHELPEHIKELLDYFKILSGLYEFIEE